MNEHGQNCNRVFFTVFFNQELLLNNILKIRQNLSTGTPLIHVFQNDGWDFLELRQRIYHLWKYIILFSEVTLKYSQNH